MTQQDFDAASNLLAVTLVIGGGALLIGGVLRRAFGTPVSTAVAGAGVVMMVFGLAGITPHAKRKLPDAARPPAPPVCVSPYTRRVPAPVGPVLCHAALPGLREKLDRLGYSYVVRPARLPSCLPGFVDHRDRDQPPTRYMCVGPR